MAAGSRNNQRNTTALSEFLRRVHARRREAKDQVQRMYLTKRHHPYIHHSRHCLAGTSWRTSCLHSCIPPESFAKIVEILEYAKSSDVDRESHAMRTITPRPPAVLQLQPTRTLKASGLSVDKPRDAAQSCRPFVPLSESADVMRTLPTPTRGAECHHLRPTSGMSSHGESTRFQDVSQCSG